MAGYAATARIERPRVVARRPEPDPLGPSDGTMVDELPLRPSDVILALRARLGEMRAELDQLTFFLLDPESWRR